MSEFEMRQIEYLVKMVKIALNQVLAPLDKKITFVDEYDESVLERWK